MNNEIHPHQHSVNLEDRSRIKGHLPLVLWMTGLSGSGKSTLANALEYRLVQAYDAHTYLLDGDNVRTGLNAGLGFTEADRRENIRRVGEVARLMYHAGLIVITAFISPYRSDRELVRSLLPHDAFWEVFVSCPIEKCIERDPKGLYRKALEGKISDFTGIDSPYEAPAAPEIRVDTGQFTVDECVELIIARMLEHQIIQQK